MRQSLPHVTLDNILLRLTDTELNVCALASSSPNGWQTKVAWNPVDTFRLGSNAEASSTGLEKFVQEQQHAGRLTIGYLSYDFGRSLHHVEPQANDDLGMPLAFVASFDSWLEFDHGGAEIVAAEESFADSVDQILSRPLGPQPTEAYSKPLQPTLSRKQYGAAYRKVQSHISAGDVYQINLTHRLEGSTKLSGRDLFCLLAKDSKSDFRAYIEDGEFEILSYSPERFIEVKSGRISTMPIKGTRPRGASPDRDKALEEDLLTSAKDRAELDMITDLMRNDLGKICEVGTVKVEQRRVLTAYPTLWHAHSRIVGELSDDVSPIAALCSVSPGGSITGCPKKRAIELIDELERGRRGVYTGSIFTVLPDGDLDSSIAIRTMIKRDSQLYLSVGGGIVHDSKDAEEYQESLDKAASFIKIT
ncbi:MAG: anthranilate synthase component I family protein [Patescibacteria group bacterium]